jgi:hypothetical protein
MTGNTRSALASPRIEDFDRRPTLMPRITDRENPIRRVKFVSALSKIAIDVVPVANFEIMKFEP